MTTFVALDVETADRCRDSACSIGLVRVEADQVVDRVHYLICPPQRLFEFTQIHGITWAMVANQPDFANCGLRSASPLIAAPPYLIFAGSISAGAIAAKTLPRGAVSNVALSKRWTHEVAHCRKATQLRTFISRLY